MGKYDGVFPAGTVVRDLTGIRIMGAPKPYRHEKPNRFERTRHLGLKPLVA